MRQELSSGAPPPGPIERTQEQPQVSTDSAAARLFKAVVVEHRVPYRVQMVLDGILANLGFRTRVVSVDGLRFVTRRGEWDEGFARRVIERDEYARKGFEFQPTDTIVDIGANIGAFCVQYAARRVPKGRVVAIEPASDNFELLERNVGLNGLANVTLVRAAVAGHSGSITLYRGEASGVHSTTEGHLNASYGTETVEAMTLEDLFLRYRIDRCRLLKMNCEGAEFEILYGAPAAVLARIDRIAMEYHAKSDKRQKANRLVEFLCGRGFHVDQYVDYVELDCGFLSLERAPEGR